MRVRPALPSDAAEIQEVQARSAREAYEGVLADEALIERMEDASTIEDLEEWLAATADDERVVYLVATDRAHEVVGFLQLLAGERAPDRTAPDEAFLSHSTSARTGGERASGLRCSRRRSTGYRVA